MEAFLALNTCHYLLANGRPCRCFAKRNSDFCRHHQPGVRVPQPDGLPELPATDRRPMTPAERSAGWRRYHRELRSETDYDAFQEDIDSILAALGNRAISPRSAGRLLQTIEDRRRELTELELREQLQVLQQLAALQRSQATPPQEPHAR